MRPDSTRTHLLCVPGSTASTPSVAGPDGADDLDLLAAHHVGNAADVATDEPGNDRHLVARGRPDARNQRCRVGGALGVRHLDPALAAADHPAGDPGHALVGPVAEQGAQCLRVLAGAHLHDPQRRLALGEHDAPATEPIGAGRRGAPIECQQRGGGTRTHKTNGTASRSTGQVVRPINRARRTHPSGAPPGRRSRAHRPSARRRASLPSSRTARGS